MKKTYIQPAMLVVKINTVNPLQTSSPKYSETETQATSGNFSKRRRGIFQDDYEEDQSIW